MEPKDIPDEGNPGAFWRTYKGMYNLTKADSSTDVVMLTTNNSVQFTKDVHLAGHNSEDGIALLDLECCPSQPVTIPVAFEGPDKSVGATLISIYPDGIITCGISGDFTLLLCGVSFNIATNFYGGDANAS